MNTKLNSSYLIKADLRGVIIGGSKRDNFLSFRQVQEAKFTYIIIEEKSTTNQSMLGI